MPDSNQEIIDSVSKPVSERFEYYCKQMIHIKAKLDSFFFDEKRVKKLTEVPQGDQLVVSFNQLESSMRNCLVDEQILYASAQQIRNETSSAYLSFVTALDQNVAASGLPLVLKEDGSYHFLPEKPYTPFVQTFMEQFAFALGVYRMCLGICESYNAIYHHDSIQSYPHKDYSARAEQYKQQFEQGIGWFTLDKQAEPLIEEGYSLLTAGESYKGMDQFKSEFPLLQSQLNGWFDTGTAHLKNAYSHFPNNAILWVLRPRSWHTLIENLCDSLFPNSKVRSTYYTTLNINSAYADTLKTEVDSFGKTLAEHTPKLRIELLKAALKTIQDTRIDIRAELAEKRILLPRASTNGFFSNSAASNFYRTGAEFMRQFTISSLNPQEEEEKSHTLG
ncbi:coiled-coil protein [Legionella birminghamensis]|uniref:Coiled-coil protein n=2 Tax=Legionella birminghamensis TaxID=28083 RepID=A0A378I8D8_9GAMM|nr:hypothetical protein [Legionella birminghamensis]KTC71501.1 coiled-coil protein [Legionella birminghamensis]STX30891.1 coiled-coil protein [Legionella birminghamensis]